MIWLLGCAPPAASEEDACAEAPYADWETFGAGFVTQHCRACHGRDAPDRHDAPDDVALDAAEDVWAIADRVLARAAAEPPTMPPAGGTTEEERALLRAWLGCGPPGE
ncbi:MAG: hypothetical protein ACOZNI_18010 [Myxococcota bacterium]